MLSFSLTLGNGMNNTSGVSVVSVGSNGSSVGHRSGIDSGGVVMSISVVRAGVSVSVSIRMDSGVTVSIGVKDGGVGLGISLGFGIGFSIALPPSTVSIVSRISVVSAVVSAPSAIVSTIPIVSVGMAIVSVPGISSGISISLGFGFGCGISQSGKEKNCQLKRKKLYIFNQVYISECFKLTTFMVVEVSPGTTREDGSGPPLYILAFLQPTPEPTLRSGVAQ